MNHPAAASLAIRVTALHPMKTNPQIRACTFLLSAVALTGCAHDRAASRPPHDPGQRVVYTGSHIPQPRDQLTPSPLSANTPPESVSRHPDSLVPTEPVVGATDNTRN